MYETPEVEKMDSKTGPVPVVVNFAAVVDSVAQPSMMPSLRPTHSGTRQTTTAPGRVQHRTSRRLIEQSPRLSLHAIDCAAPANVQSALKSCL